MNIYDALNEYKQYLLIEKKVSDNTLKNYMRDLEHFINYIQKQNQVVLINQIDKDMIRKYYIFSSIFFITKNGFTTLIL